MNDTLIAFGIGLAVSVGVSVFLRYIPKSKAIDAGKTHGKILGQTVSKFGNSKFSKKVWNKVEEGPIVTGASYIMSFVPEFLKSLISDNESKED